MRTIRIILALSISLSWASKANACHEDRAKVIKSNTYLMSEPSKLSKVILKLPNNFDNLRGCITSDLSRQDYKVDRSGTKWNYVDASINNREVKGWVMTSKIKVVTRCCQS
jgi:hypothetical protein